MGGYTLMLDQPQNVFSFSWFHCGFPENLSYQTNRLTDRHTGMKTYTSCRRSMKKFISVLSVCKPPVYTVYESCFRVRVLLR